jgi:hypothetical protein
MKDKLNQREQEVVSVMIDLFMKGLPETRIAKYCHDKHMTYLQVHKFLLKLPLADPVRVGILNAFKEMEHGVIDRSQKTGEELNDWWNRTKNPPSA